MPLLGKSGGVWGSRNYENLLFIINLFQLDELALYMRYTLARISNTPSERGNEMKKIFTVVMAVAFAFSVAGFAVAADNAVKPMKAAEKSATSAEKSAVSAEKSAASAEKSATEAKKSAKKAKGQKVSGTIEALDVAAGTFTVKGKKGNVDLKAGEKVKLDSFKVGDKVYVKYADGTASSVKGVKATGRAAKKATKKAAREGRGRCEARADAGGKEVTGFTGKRSGPTRVSGTHGQGDTIPLPFF